MIIALALAAFLSACGPVNLPGSLDTVLPEPDACLEATPAAQEQFPDWRTEVALASDWTGLPVEPRDSCENLLDYALTAEDTLSEADWDGDLRSSFHIVVNSDPGFRGDLHVIQSTDVPCPSNAVWLASLIARQLAFFADRPIPNMLPICGPWPEQVDGGAP